MAAIGTMQEFDVTSPASWPVYIQRLEFFLEANAIATDERKRAVFLSLCGNATFEIARSLVAPNELLKTPIKTIIELLDKHFTPKPSEIVQRFKFHKRDQKLGEGAADYLAELRKIAEFCNFGNTLETMLRDRLVCGIRDENVQRRLLAESELTFKMAFDTIIAVETTSRQVADMRVGIETSREGGQCAGARDSDTNLVHATSTKGSGRQFSDKCQNRTPLHNLNKKPRGREKPCFRCGERHDPATCRFKNSDCRYCKKIGHIERVCLAKKNSTKPIQHVSESVDARIFQIGQQNTRPFRATVKLNGKDCRMEVDSGAGSSLISHKTFITLWPTKRPKLSPCNLKFSDYQGNEIKTEGTCNVQVEFNGRSRNLPVIITSADRSSILGRSWFTDLGIVISTNQIKTNDLELVLKQHEEVFQEDLGSFRGPPVRLDLDPNVKPISLKARNVAYALRPKVEQEIDRLIRQGILVEIDNPEWTTPIVPVIKADGTSVRLCADYKCTINRALRKDPYPMPSVYEMLATLNQAKVFAKLDMAQAYQQLRVDDESARAQTIITHKGTFSVNRLQFGVSVAPQIFQRFMNNRLAGIPGVFPYFDDILLSANSREQLTERLNNVLSKFKSDGLRLKRDKCVFFAESIEFLGYRITNQGITPTSEKVKAIKTAPEPRNKQELQSFLGLLNFYHMFLKEKANIAEPLHRLLDKNTSWKWARQHRNAFNKLKDLLTSESLLIHYDSNKPIVLTCDASPWGVGCVLSHVSENELQAPIAFHSKTLNAAERKYAQLDREALAIVTGVRKFHNYLYGRSFQIITDHKPLLGILGEKKPFPELSSPRMTRWALFLSNYDYTLNYQPGKEIGHADALSRLPPVEANTDFEERRVENVLMVEHMPEAPLKADKIAALIGKDPVLSNIRKFLWFGWPSRVEEDIKPYRNRKTELSVYRNCVLWGERVVIPEVVRPQLLNLLHGTHIGVVRMKAMARSYMWWPGIDKQIEETAKSCELCQSTQNAPARAPVHPWEWASRPWSRLHIDFAGPFRGKILLIVVDSYSKWTEVKIVPTTSSIAAIRVLRELFATHGLPDVVVSDNGTAFTSDLFQNFLKRNGIRQALVAPYHPASNGQAERMVQEVKRTLGRLAPGDWDLQISRFLISQHSTPSTVTGLSPAEVLFQRKIKTCLSLIQPNFVEEMRDKQSSTARASKPPRTFQPEDQVLTRSQASQKTWIPETVVRATGPLSYKTRGEDGQLHRRHVDQMQKHHVETSARDRTITDPWEIAVTSEPQSTAALQDQDPGPSCSSTTLQSSPPEDEVPSTDRPIRERRPPAHFSDFECKL